jgi:hypothetical protein
MAEISPLYRHAYAHCALRSGWYGSDRLAISDYVECSVFQQVISGGYFEQ